MALAELTKALVAAQREMPSVKKTAKANYGNYATLDHLIARTRPVLTKHGLAITQFPSASDLGQPTLVTRLVHESGEALEYSMPLFLGPKQTMQDLGSALTYARRYAWASALGISDEDDDDGQHAAATKVEQDTEAKAKPAEKPAVNATPDPVTAALHGRILELAKEFGTNLVTVQKSINDNRTNTEGYLKKHHEWCERQVKTLEANIAAKKSSAESSFQPPPGVKDKAA